MHCNLRPTLSQSFSALTETPVPCQVRSRSIYLLLSYSVFTASLTLRCDTDLRPCDLDFDLWPWTFLVYRLWSLSCDETLYQIWAKSNNLRRSYYDFNIWPYDLEHVSRRVPLCSGIIFTQFKLGQPIRSWNVTIFWCWYVM